MVVVVVVVVVGSSSSSSTTDRDSGLPLQVSKSASMQVCKYASKQVVLVLLARASVVSCL